MDPSTNENKVGPIEAFMAEDHVRIDQCLLRAEREDGSIDNEAYAAFRSALLRHIAMEEKVLFPIARAKRGGVALPIAASLHEDHGVIAKLLVRSPSVALLNELGPILERHNAREEGAGGLYATCDALLSEEAHDLVARMREQPEVPLAKYYDGPSHARR